MITTDFKVKIEKDEDGFFVATVPSLPGCISQGRTEEEAYQNIQEAIQLHMKALAEDGIHFVRDKTVKEVTVSVSL